MRTRCLNWLKNPPLKCTSSTVDLCKLYSIPSAPGSKPDKPQFQFWMHSYKFHVPSQQRFSELLLQDFLFLFDRKKAHFVALPWFSVTRDASVSWTLSFRVMCELQSSKLKGFNRKLLWFDLMGGSLKSERSVLCQSSCSGVRRIVCTYTEQQKCVSVGLQAAARTLRKFLLFLLPWLRVELKHTDV